MLSIKEIKRIQALNKVTGNISKTARKSGHSRSTVRKYLNNPCQNPKPHNWKTRNNPFEGVWDEIKELLQTNPGLQAKTIFDYLCKKYPEKFSEGQLRTLQRHIKTYKASEGPHKEVMFEQTHHPGELSASDFTSMNSLRITILGEPFNHLLYHFVLTYSNWEWARVCSSESFESLKAGLKESLYKLGGTPKEHLTDRLSAAVHNLKNPGEFKKIYDDLLSCYGIKGRATQPRSPNENGDIEQRHHRLKTAIDQQLMLRGSRDFCSKENYVNFLHGIVNQLNSSRKIKLDEELKELSPLRDCILPDYTIKRVAVSQGSAIRVKGCTYSVPSRLIGEKVEIRLFEDELECWYANKKVFFTKRLTKNGSYINYKHIIGTLIRKPGAFKNYKYRECLFPTTNFRMSYDELIKKNPLNASKQYLEILHLSAHDDESAVDKALNVILNQGLEVSKKNIEKIISKSRDVSSNILEPNVNQPDLSDYDKACGLGE